MASGTLSTRPPAENAPVQGRYEEFIQKRLEHTRRQVRMVDVGSGVVLLASSSLFFFLAVAVADHWIFAHGLNFTVRLVLWAAWVGVAVWFAWRWVAPSAMHRINPVFAAQTIEQTRPTLKNSLINFLLLRAHPEGVAPVFYKAMEHRAATDLARVPLEHAVDHRRLVHLCYTLAAAVVLFALYLAFSPKNPLVSAARVLWPWTSLPAPTRVHIEDVRPGHAVVFQGDRQEITAHVSGLRSGEEVALLISTADAQLIDDRVVMNRTGEDDRYACQLPPGEGGMQQTTTYRITAGDATTQQFKLDVQIAPTIIVDQVDYHFPPYTGYADQSVKGQGDIKALEGTRVTIHAAANLDIKEAYIDLGRDALRRIAMKHDGKRATGEFALALDPDHNWQPQYDRYEVVFKDVEGRDSRHPVHYHIDVDRDYPPEIEIVEPKQETAAVSVNGHLRIRLKAKDDFGLRRVTLHAERNGERLDLPVLMDRVSPEKAWDKPYDGDYDFVPAAFHLLKGDVVTYWAEAEDNKEPQHNRRETTPRRTIRIVDDQEAKQGQANQEKQPGEGAGQPEGQPQQGNGGRGKPEQGGAGNPSNDSHDGTNGEPSSANQGGKDGTSKSPDSKQGGSNDPSKSKKNKGGNDDGTKGGPSSDSNDGQSGEPGSSESSGQDKNPLDPKNQAADAIKRTLKDLEKQEKNEGGDNPKSSPDQKPQNADNGGTQPKGSPNNGGQSDKSGQGNSENSSPQGGRGDQPQAGSGRGNPQNGNSGASPPSGKPGDAGSNSNNAAQQPNAGTQGLQNASPQRGSTSPKGTPNGGDKSNAGKSTPQGSGNQDNNQTRSSAGPQKNGENAGAENKPDNKQMGGNKQGQDNQQASGGNPSSKEKMTGGQQGGKQPGGSPQNQNAEKKPGGGEGSPNNSQLGMNGQKPEKNGSEHGSSAGQNTPNSQKPDNKTKPESGNAPGGGQTSQSKPGKKDQGGGGGPGSEQQSKPDNGEKPGPGGGGQESPDGSKQGKPGEMSNGEQRQMAPGKSGESTNPDSHGAPDPQVDPQRGGNQAGNAHPGLNPKQDNNAQSPSISPHNSDSTGESDGDRNGRGGRGGGQEDKKPGRGSPGSSTAASNGGAACNEKGEDAAGNKTGEAVKTTGNTASPRKEAGSGDGEKTDPANKQTGDDSKQSNENNPSAGNPNQNGSAGGPSGSPSPASSSHKGSGQPSGGSTAGDQPPVTQQSTESKPDEADPIFAQKQVDLALRHLKDETSKPKSELLDKLGWTPEEAKKFAENIEKLRDSAKQPGNEGEANKKIYNELLKDLGLRPHGTQIQGGQTATDNLRNVRDAGQIDPPAEWLQATREFSRSAAGQK